MYKNYIFFCNINMIFRIIILYIGLGIRKHCCTQLSIDHLWPIKNYFEYLLWDIVLYSLSPSLSSLMKQSEIKLLPVFLLFWTRINGKIGMFKLLNIYTKNYLICRCLSLTSFGLLKHHNYTMVEWKEKSQEIHVLLNLRYIVDECLYMCMYLCCRKHVQQF